MLGSGYFKLDPRNYGQKINTVFRSSITVQLFCCNFRKRKREDSGEEVLRRQAKVIRLGTINKFLLFLFSHCGVYVCVKLPYGMLGIKIGYKRVRGVHF